MANYTTGTMRKVQTEDGQWEWFGQFSIRQDGKQRQFTHRLGIACDPLTDEERKAGRKFVPSGKGVKRAEEAFRKWRQALIDAERAKETEEQRKAEEAAELAALPAAARLTTGEYVAYYLTTRHNMQASTATTNRYIAKYIENSPALAKPIRELTTDDVQSWMKELEENEIGSATVSKAYVLLKASLAYAEKSRHIVSNPVRPVDPPKRAEPKQPNPLDNANIAILNSSLDTYEESDPSKWRFVAAVRIALLTGMRQGEICGLRWADIEGWEDGDFKGRTMTVRHSIGRAKGKTYIKPPKNGKERKIGINSELAEVFTHCKEMMLAEYGDENSTLTGALFVVGKAVPPEKADTSYYSPNYLGHQWNMYVRTIPVIGLEGGKPRFHDIRSTYATQCLAQNYSDERIAQILGHDATVLRKIYAKYLPKKGQEIQDHMGGILGARSADKSEPQRNKGNTAPATPTKAARGPRTRARGPREKGYTMERNTTLVEVMDKDMGINEFHDAAQSLGMSMESLCNVDVLTADGLTLARICRALNISADTLLERANAATA